MPGEYDWLHEGMKQRFDAERESARRQTAITRQFLKERRRARRAEKLVHIAFSPVGLFIALLVLFCLYQLLIRIF